MLILVIILTGAACFIEAKIVNNIPVLGRLLEKSPLYSLFFSMGLSMLMGMFFGAAGLICMAAGISSSLLMVPYYAARRNGQLKEISKVWAATKDTWNNNWNSTVEFFRILHNMLKFLAVLVKYMLFVIMGVLRGLNWAVKKVTPSQPTP